MTAREFVYYCYAVFYLHTAIASCPVNEKDALVSTLADVKRWSECKTITGDLVIGSCDDDQSPSPIDDSAIGEFDKLVNVTGRLRVACTSITYLRGFDQLVAVGDGVEIRRNPSLLSISVLNKLKRLAGSLVVVYNPMLSDVGGFQSLTEINGSVQIDRNARLTNLSALLFVETIGGGELIAGYYALSISYNVALENLHALRQLKKIQQGTVHVEGNRMLCFAGYPQWGQTSFVRRPRDDTGDKGINWLWILNGSSSPDILWSWSKGDDYVPTLLVRDNGDGSQCDAIQCSASCKKGAGCWADDANSCGECGGLCNDFAPSDSTSAGWWPPFRMPYLAIFVAVVVAVVLLIILIAIGCVLCCRWRRRERKGSFRLKSSESRDDLTYEVESGLDDGGVAMQSMKPLESSVDETTWQKTTEDVPPVQPVAGKQQLKEEKRRQKEEEKRLKEEEKRLKEEEKRKKKELGKMEKEKLKHKGRTSSGSSLDDNIILQPGNPNESLLEEKAGTRSMADHILMNFPRDQLKFDKELGDTGTFKVYEGTGHRIVSGLKKTKIVIQELANVSAKPDFLKGLEHLWYVEQHANVLALLALCTEADPYLAVLENCPQGNLKTYLIRHRWDAAALKERRVFVRIAVDMATGLDVLHQNNFIHGDVATRNFQLASDMSVKIGDYGLAKQLFRDDYHEEENFPGLLPVRWMAPESLKRDEKDGTTDVQPRTKAADVWSFGVALWEILSMAQRPYEALSNEEVIESVIFNQTAVLLTNPSDAVGDDSQIFTIAQACWLQPEVRPTTVQLLEAADALSTSVEVPDSFRMQFDPEKHSSPTRKQSPSRRNATAASPLHETPSRPRPTAVEQARSIATSPVATSSPNIVPRQVKRLSDVTTSPGVVKGSPPLTASASERKSEILEALEQAANEDEEMKKTMSPPRKSSLRSPIDIPKEKKSVSFNSASETFNISIVSLRSLDEGDETEEEDVDGDSQETTTTGDEESLYYRSDTLDRKKRQQQQKDSTPVKATDLDSLKSNDEASSSPASKDDDDDGNSSSKTGDNVSALIW